MYLKSLFSLDVVPVFLYKLPVANANNCIFLSLATVTMPLKLNKKMFVKHEILTFAVADIWFRNTWLSILCTFLMHHLVRIVREILGESNLSERTLVDQRFLI